MTKVVVRAFALFMMLAALLAVPVYAKDPKKTALPTVVLLPVILHGEQSKDAMASYQGAISESLKSRYKVIVGSKVEEVLKKVMLKESQKENCDMTRCYGAIATEFNAEYVAVVDVTKAEGDYSVSLKVMDVVANELEMSKTDTCRSCKMIDVVEKLKLLAGGEKAATAGETPAEAAQSSKGAGGNEMELTYWNSIKESVNPDDFAAYLSDYPKGKFVSLAKSRMASLKKAADQAQESASKKAVEEASTKELAFWSSIKDSANPDDLAAYLQDYPKGTFASLAKSRMASLKKPAPQAQAAPAKEVDAGSRSTSELDIWKSVKDSINPDDLSLYLQAFPNGAFSVTAKNRIEVLKKDAAKKAAAEKAAAEKATGERAAAERAAAKKAAEEQAAAEKAAAMKAAEERAAIEEATAMKAAEERAAAEKAAVKKAAIVAERSASKKYAAEVASAAAAAAENEAKMKMANPPKGMVYVKKGDGGFYMDKTEVTQEAYQRVNGNNPSYFSGCPTCPVERVTWQEAADYCTRVEKRLPAKQEWEYAATSGGKEEKYAGTNDESNLGEYAYYKDNSGKKTHPVGEKKPNSLGLYDMTGNVWEWIDSRSYDSKEERVLRGGSWNDIKDNLRTSSQLNSSPDLHDYSFGFRCAQ